MIDLNLKGANILIVDDQEANIDILEGLLEIQGYTNFKSTADPRQVTELFVSFKPDLILLDLSMPYLSGFEVMEQLKALVPVNTYLPILVLTADVTNAARQRALSNGAQDFLSKPFDLVEVGLRIKNLLFMAFLQQQLQNQNLILEEKVLERTAELEVKNIELIAAKEKAEASDRLKTAFLQNISHEVRTPLNGIIGFASLLAEMDLSIVEKREFVHLMQVSSDRLINTITDYVDMALIMSGNLEFHPGEINLTKLLNDLKIKFLPLCVDNNISLNVFMPADVGGLALQTDLELLQKILSHLIDNAIKFTSLGTVTVGFSKISGAIEFFVKDTGIGIEEEVQERIFDIFMQENVSSTRVFEGSGLGLSIVKGVAGFLGGQIRLESVKGVGSSFFFSLPY